MLRSSGVSSAAFTALFNCATTAGARPAGPMTDSQVPPSMANPCSVSVARSGAAGRRLADARPNNFSRPPCCWGIATDSGIISTSTWFEASAVMAGAAPWKGTCSTSILAACLNISKAICEELPTPQEA
ncbi:hypothetical protein D3C78_1442600 [compost metagenome]